MKLFRETRAREIPPCISKACWLSCWLRLHTCPAKPRRRPAMAGPRVDDVKSQFCDRLTLEELAREAGVHPVHLSRVFRKCEGEGIGEYVHRLRIRAACEQMFAPQKSLAEIGLETGFADQSHFTRAFRRITGMSPGAFRIDDSKIGLFVCCGLAVTEAGYRRSMEI